MGARLIDASGQLKRPLKRKSFLKPRVVSVALNDRNEVVGVAVIEKGKGDVVGSGKVTVWFYRPLARDMHCASAMEELTRDYRRLEALPD